MNLILGTATFGTRYGIANSGNMLNELETLEILQEAKYLGITHLDTAPVYGPAEEIVGKFHTQESAFEVISKISDVHDFSSQKLIQELKESITKLGISKFSAILFHKTELLAEYPIRVINETINRILSTGLVKRFGVSVYEEEEIYFVSKNFPQITLFQVPENIMDRRLLESDLVTRLASQGFIFHIRSVFLQGLLLMKSNDVSSVQAAARFGLGKLDEYSKLQGISVLDACLNYVSRIEWASGVVVGVNSKEHLREIVDFQRSELAMNCLPTPFSKEILDPRSWKIS
jgi:aryl-alcohol dehydrogenase-like predicted oxidoreductase